MFSESYLQFVQDKIQDLNSALFFNLSDAVLKIPTTIISVIKVDEVGQVWFFVQRPRQRVHEFDKEFPSRLDFLRKGKQYSMSITGKACIVSDPEELNGLVSFSEDVKKRALDKLLLVKVKIQQAEYYDHTPESSHNWLNNFKNHLVKFFHKTPPGFSYQS